jgi:uncharacterized protein
VKVLVTGATGFIGLPLLRALQDHGNETSALTREPAASRDKAPGTDMFAWQAASEVAPAQALAGADAVVNLAGESVEGRWHDRQKKAIRDSRVHGTRNLIEGLESASPRPKVLVSASAIGYYGDRGEEQLNEDSPPGAGYLAEVCRDWEQAAQQAEQLGVRVVRLRFGIVLGPGGGAMKQLLRIYRLGLGGPIGSGRQWWAWVHRDDVIGVILHAIESDVSGALNVAAPHPTRQAEFAKTLGRVVGRPAILPAPAFAIKAALGGFSQELLFSRHPEPRRTTASGYVFRFPELEPALTDIVKS